MVEAAHLIGRLRELDPLVLLISEFSAKFQEEDPHGFFVASNLMRHGFGLQAC